MTPTRTRRTTLASAGLVTIAGVAAGITLTAAPSAAAGQPLRFSTTAVEGRQAFLDQEPTGDVPTPGDAEISEDDLLRNGRTVGTVAGVCTVVTVAPRRLVAACTATALLPEGQLTVQGVNVEDPTQGPGRLVWAVTGGTGRYAAARGEAVGTLRPGTDVVDWEVRLA